MGKNLLQGKKAVDLSNVVDLEENLEDDEELVIDLGEKDQKLNESSSEDEDEEEGEEEMEEMKKKKTF